MTKSILVVVLLIPFVSASHADQVSLLVNQTMGQAEFTDRILKKVFLGRYKTSEKGAAISPCYLDEPKVRDELYKISKKSADKYRRYWNKRLFSGTGVPPKVFKSREKVYQYMRSEEGAVCLSMSDTDIPGEISSVVLD